MPKVDPVQKKDNFPTENVGKIKINGKWYRVREVKQNIKITKSVKEALQNALNDKFSEKPRKFNVIATCYKTDITYGDESQTIEDLSEKKEITAIWQAVHTKDNHPQTDHQGSSERSGKEGHDDDFGSCHTSRRGSEVSDEEVVPLPKRRSTSSGRSSESVNRDDQENPDLDNPKLQKADEYYRERELKKAISAFKMHTIKSKNKRKQNEKLKKLREFNVKNHAFGLWKKETQQRSDLERKLEELKDNIKSLGGYPDCINSEDTTENSITDRIKRAKDYVNKLQELNYKCNTLLGDVDCAKGTIDKIRPNIINKEELLHKLNEIQEKAEGKSKRYFLYEDVNEEIDYLSEDIKDVNQLIQELESIVNESESVHASPSHKEPLQPTRPADSSSLKESAEQRSALETQLENLTDEIHYLKGIPDSIDVKDRKENSITKRIELAEDYVGKLRAIHKNIKELNHKAKTANDLLSEIKERISRTALRNLKTVNEVIEKINNFIEEDRISLTDADLILSDLTENINIANGIIKYLKTFNESDQSSSDEEIEIEQLSEGMTSDGDIENFLSSTSSTSIPVLPRRQHPSTDNFEFALSSCSSESESEKDQSGSFHTASESGSKNLDTPRSSTQRGRIHFSTVSENGEPIRSFSEEEPEAYYGSEGAPSTLPLPEINRRSSANQRRGLPESPNGEENGNLYLPRGNSRRYTQSPSRHSVHSSSEERRSNRGDSSQVPRSPTNSAAEVNVSGVEGKTSSRHGSSRRRDLSARSGRRGESKDSTHAESSQQRRRGERRRGSKPSSNAASDAEGNVSGVKGQTPRRPESSRRRASDQQSNSSREYPSDVSEGGDTRHSSTTSGDSLGEE